MRLCQDGSSSTHAAITLDLCACTSVDGTNLDLTHVRRMIFLFLWNVVCLCNARGKKGKVSFS